MNTFYTIEGSEIREIRTVKDLAFIKKRINKKAVESIDDLEIPEGHVIEKNVIVKTPEKEKQDRINALKSELAQSDIDMSRVYEDMMDVLITKGVFRKEDLPQKAIDKIEYRKQKRSELASLERTK